MHSSTRHAMLDSAQRQAEEVEAARQRLIQMADTGQPTPATPAAPVSTKAARS